MVKQLGATCPGSPEGAIAGRGQVRHRLGSGLDLVAGVRDTGRREGAAGNTAGAGSVRQSSHISRDVCLQASPLGSYLTY